MSNFFANSLHSADTHFWLSSIWQIVFIRYGCDSSSRIFSQFKFRSQLSFLLIEFFLPIFRKSVPLVLILNHAVILDNLFMTSSIFIEIQMIVIFFLQIPQIVFIHGRLCIISVPSLLTHCMLPFICFFPACLICCLH
jgi:hypothetical protein